MFVVARLQVDRRSDSIASNDRAWRSSLGPLRGRIGVVVLAEMIQPA